MSGSATPQRVAIVGSGPAGFYTVQHLLASDVPPIEIDMFDRLPTPFGLVRHGVAPDHLKIKNVIAVYHKLACRTEFRFFGNVEYGRDVDLDDLRRHYHQVVFCTGAQTDRRLGIPGEDLDGSHPATDFVAWYNGHPDFSHLNFNLQCEAAVVIGVGNVAVDVARILCRTPDELRDSDIADYALEALVSSCIRTVHLVGRRGAAQAAFTNPEVKELGEMRDAAVLTHAEEVEPDPLSREAIEASGDKATRRKLEILASYAHAADEGKRRRLEIRFLLSPMALLGDEYGRVRAVRLVRNRLERDVSGALKARATDETLEIPAGLVFRSVGYHGVPLPGLPFDERSGTVPNDRGRVLGAPDGAPLDGLYVSGWIKRGPTGVIGTNKPDALETVERLREDREAGRSLFPEAPQREAIDALLATRGLRAVSYAQWEKLDALEIARGAAAGRPRLKFTRREQILDALDRP